ncbi:hypothetical protein SCP_1503230 [Sparassis crispa]|uniref:BTB domain-containing protein n=1 Tax=Sparassis crispa TaxID=139825 RepID=A0A401H4E8_9APHY|nr:hypothetical protein SCP_1503230 [Sparassis crispa]GBE89315.1 hypothetical protein SCP_1503230 [Sparassis crispa]
MSENISSSRCSLTDMHEHSACEAGEPRHDTRFWFVDGSVILIAQGTAFRVHQTVLSRHSEIFRDLFSVPQPAEQERLSGCPVVHLSDSPTDLQHLLHVLYDCGLSYYKLTPGRFNFAEVAAVVRMAHKYRLDELLQDGISLVKTIFTNNFENWTTLRWREEFLIRSPSLSMQVSDAVIAVNVIRLISIPSMLPTALYLCCFLSPTELIRGRACPDGSTVKLSSEDLEKCLTATPFLHCGNDRRRLSLISRAGPRCSKLSECIAGLPQWLESEIESSVDPCPAVLESLDHAIDVLAITDTICEDCVEFAKSRDLERRHEWWNQLPSLLGLGTWSDLNDSIGAPNISKTD